MIALRMATLALGLALAAAACARRPRPEPAAPPPRPMAAPVDVRIRLTDTLRSVLDQAVRDSAFPGAIAVVGSRSGILATVAAGRLDWNEPSIPDEHTLWDLASLTKVVGTTSAMIRLVGEGRIELDAPVQRYLPRWSVAGQAASLPASTAGDPASSRKVDAPVMSSPAMTACCTGAAPRQAGSSEKCRFTQPCRGRSRAACGTSAP